MIRHRPFGRGHAYRIEPDQRVPAWPVADQPIELRATTPPGGASAPLLELEIDGRRQERPTHSFQPEPDPASTLDGHLAGAASGADRTGRRAWRAVVEALPAGTTLRYRFRGPKAGATRWHAVRVAGWHAEGGRLVLDPDRRDGRLVEDSVRWLRADAGPIRVRLALALEPGSHVIGFGERFDRFDQAGRRLDAIVFEQYRSQGSRTYLPMPFAIVVPARRFAGLGLPHPDGAPLVVRRRRERSGPARDRGRARPGRTGARDRGQPVRGLAGPDPGRLPGRGRLTAGAPGLAVSTVDERQRMEHAMLGSGQRWNGRSPRAFRRA